MGEDSRREVEFAAMEHDSYPAVGKLPEAAGIGFDGLKSAVDTSAFSVSDFVATVRQQVLQMAVDHVGNLDHR